MDEATNAIAVETSTPPQQETIELPKSGTPEYATWRVSGDLPEKPKAGPAPAPSETRPASEAETTQETRVQPKPKPTAEERIAQLESTIEKIRKGAGLETKKAEPSPAPVEQPKPQLVQQQQPTRPKPTPEDKNSDGTPKFKIYEDYIEELADWKAEQRMEAQSRAQAARAQQQALQAQLDKAKTRYGNLDEVIKPAAATIMQDPQIPGIIKQMINDSEVLPELLYKLGSDQEKLTAFVNLAKSDPRKAITQLVRLEQDEDAPKTEPAARNGKGQFVPQEPAPAKRGPESAPEPPLEVGNRGSGAVDPADRAFSAIERGDAKATRAWLDAENAKDLRRRRGA